MLNNLDHIFVITLKNAFNRRKKFEQNNKNLVKLPIFEWLFVDENHWGGGVFTPMKSNFYHQQKCVKIAKKRNYNTILIFEDDARLLVPWSEFVLHFNNLLRPNDWVYIMFGYLPVKLLKTSDKHLFVVNCAYDAHAYLVNVSKTIELQWSLACEQFDYTFCNCNGPIEILKSPERASNNILTGMTYAYYPMLFDQDKSADSMTSINEEHFFNLYNGRHIMPHIATHINTLVFAVIILVVFFIILLIICLAFSNYLNYNPKIIQTIIVLVIVIVLILTGTGIEVGINDKKIVSLNYY